MRELALIFDFGNVFAFFSYSRACESIGAPLGKTGDQILEQLAAQGLNAWIRLYETGKMSSDEFMTHVAEASGSTLSLAELRDAWRDIFWLNEPVVELVANLDAQGYSLVLGSNTNELHAESFRVTYAEALLPFRELVLSYQVGHMKPDGRFYLACAHAAGRNPSACVFIDDLPANVQGAIGAGLQGVHYQNDEQLVTDLRRLGIDV